MRETQEKIARCVANQTAYEEKISDLDEQLRNLNGQVSPFTLLSVPRPFR